MADELASFVENVNFVANATKASTGDVVEDAQIARDGAVAAANEALSSANDAQTSEDLAEEWAQKAFNSPITGSPNGRSSFHWSEIARANSGDTVISDSVISYLQTWSSQKISDQLALKASSDHLHTNVYEPAFGKNTAFNKSFGTTGTSSSVSRDDHTHTNVYEPAIGSKGTAFNKNFGTTSGTVSEGTHTHSNVYMPYVIPKTAYNVDFGTTAGTASQGNHVHTASAVSYDNSGNLVISSGNVQGAIGQLDAYVSVLSVSENSYMTAGSSTQYERTIAGANTPVRLDMALASLSNGNASLTNGASVNVVFGIEPTKKIEGFYTVTITTTSADNVALYLAVDDVIQGESITGTGTLTITKYLTLLDETGFTLSAYIANLDNTNNVFIESMAIAWEGTPQGALVASGTSVDHSDLTGTGAANGVHTISDIQGLQTELDAKPDKVGTPVDGNFVSMNGTGDLTDSGVATSITGTLISKISPATLDNIAIQETDGSLKDGGVALSGLATVNGSNIEVFAVDTAVSGDDAINKTTFDNTVAALALDSDLTTHTSNVSNPHTVTAAQVGAAETAHIHAIADTTGLQDTLDLKYTIVNPAVQDNLVSFGLAGIVEDSGVAHSKLVQSDTSLQGGTQIPQMISMTQTQYDGITPNASTLYIITGA